MATLSQAMAAARDSPDGAAWRTAAPSMPQAYARVLEQSRPQRRVDEPRCAAPARAGEGGAPGRIRKERVRQRDRVARPHAQAAAPRELVDRPGDDPKAYAVELAEERRDLARERAVDERLQEDGLGAVLALVHRDELTEDSIRGLPAWPPTLDSADESLRPSPQRGIHETLLRRRMQIDGPWRHVRSPRDFAHAQVRESAARHLTQGSRFDRAGCSCGPARALALHVPPAI